jgi:hypothetical protein
MESLQSNGLLEPSQILAAESDRCQLAPIRTMSDLQENVLDPSDRRSTDTRSNLVPPAYNRVLPSSPWSPASRDSGRMDPKGPNRIWNVCKSTILLRQSQVQVPIHDAAKLHVPRELTQYLSPNHHCAARNEGSVMTQDVFGESVLRDDTQEMSRPIDEHGISEDDVRFPALTFLHKEGERFRKIKFVSV